MLGDEGDGTPGIRRRLQSFFHKRPTRESLVNNGVIRNREVFGSSLEELYRKSNRPIPEFVKKSIQCIEAESMITMEGVYRIPGVLSKIQKLRMEVDNGNLTYLDLTDSLDVYIIGGSLKLFFRELQEPLIPWDIVEEMHVQLEYGDEFEEVDIIRESLEKLPLWHKLTLQVVVKHLVKVSDYKAQNKMEITNLAVIFGPTLMSPPMHMMSGQLAVGMKKQTQVLEILLELHDQVFDDAELAKYDVEPLTPTKNPLYSPSFDSVPAGLGVSTNLRPKGLEKLRANLGSPKLSPKSSPSSPSSFSMFSGSSSSTTGATFGSGNSTPRLLSDKYVFNFPQNSPKMKKKSQSTMTLFKKGENRSIAERLKSFFSLRKTFSELFKKGIIELPNVFGSSLIKLQEQSQRDVPIFVTKSIEEIEKYLNEPMIYGTSGNLSQIQSIRLEVDEKADCAILDSTKDVYILAGALKLFFRELQEPLIPWEVVTSLFSAIQQPNAQTKLDRMSESLSIMPLAHHGTLVILIQHLKKVIDYDPKTDINNMAITFGPNLMWAPLKLQSANTTVTIQKQQMVIKGLLENANDLFELSDRSRRSSRHSTCSQQITTFEPTKRYEPQVSIESNHSNTSDVSQMSVFEKGEFLQKRIMTKK